MREKGASHPELSIRILNSTSLISSQVVPTPCQALLLTLRLCTVCNVSKYHFSSARVFPPRQSLTTNRRLLGKAPGPLARKDFVGVLCKSHWTCVWPTESGRWSRFLCSPPLHSWLCFGHSSEHVATEALWSTRKCPSEGQFLDQVQLNIEANNAGTVLPLPGSRTRVAKSVEKGCCVMNRI